MDKFISGILYIVLLASMFGVPAAVIGMVIFHTSFMDAFIKMILGGAILTVGGMIVMLILGGLSLIQGRN